MKKNHSDKRLKTVFACWAVGLGCLSFAFMASGLGEKAYLAVSGGSKNSKNDQAITAEASEAERENAGSGNASGQEAAKAADGNSSENSSGGETSSSAGGQSGSSAGGSSASSEEETSGSGSSGKTAVRLASPQKLQAENKYKKVKLTWKSVKNADQYLIYRKGEGGTFKKIASSGKASYVDTTARAGRNYIYTVKASASDSSSVSRNAKAVKIFTRYINPKGKMVALTFDDGPGPYTKELAQYFNKHNASATLFVIGQNVSRYHKGLAYAADHGFEIGNHTYNHIDLAKASKKTIRSQLKKTNGIVKHYTGHGPTLIRPPYGAYDQLVRDTAKKPLVLWSIDTLDWKTHSTKKTVSTTMKNVRDGDIILEHEIYQPSVKAAKILVKKLQKKGYQLVTVSELAKYKGVKLKEGIGYGSFH